MFYRLTWVQNIIGSQYKNLNANNISRIFGDKKGLGGISNEYKSCCLEKI